MAVHYRTKGFILKQNDFGEADRFFSIFTKDFGKLEVSAKAIRKIKSKLRSGAQLFWLSEIEFIQGKKQKTLTDAVSIQSFVNIKKDPTRLNIAFQIAELFDKLIKEQEKDENLWNLVNEVFNTLNTWKLKAGVSENKLKIIYYYFFWKLFSILGYQPELYHCVLCREKLKPETLDFSLAESGLVCKKCFAGQRKKQDECFIKAAPGLIKILRLILEKDLTFFLRIKITPLHQKMLQEISDNFLRYNLKQKYEK